MRIGFSQKIISPPKGILLAGYGGDPRHNIGIHDDLYCKCVVIENNNELYSIFALDLMCADESLCKKINIDNSIVCAIHSHSAPNGVFPDIGELKDLNDLDTNKLPEKIEYLNFVVDKCRESFVQAKSNLQNFVYRYAETDLPNVGSDRHDGKTPKGKFRVLEIKTDKTLLIYNFPCHPTVMNAKNLFVSADFIGQVNTGRDMSMFLNATAGDVSTRFTRKESSFEECKRMAHIVEETINSAINNEEWIEPKEFSWKQTTVELKMREILSVEDATKEYEEKLKAAEGSNDRLLRSYAEGASLSLMFSQRLEGKDLNKLHLPVSLFKLDNIKFASVPGELFSSLINREDIFYISYANGYYRYIPDKHAFDNRVYEALAAILARGEGEKLVKYIEEEL